MAITQISNFTRAIQGDGVSTTFSIDYTEDIAASFVKPRTPSAIRSIVIGISGVNIVSATLHGKIVTVVLDTAPAAAPDGFGAFTVELEFDA